ncbi:MlaE family ABC transporter permease [Mucilaginibacter sp.]|uniref:MlaE family ABC transporter permease n=1 Tax=Mucilaginibacter sp. TaxID=1882438 RepID=UPI003AFF6799
MFTPLGKYILLLKLSFKRPEKWKIYWQQIATQMTYIGVESIGLIAIISTFIGAVMTLQIAFQLTSDLIPRTIIGQVNRDSSILELSPTITALVMAGKIGSSISSEIGTMRVTEQIDALEIMGINSPGYLILPKIIAGITMMPVLVILAMFLSILGGYFGGSLSGAVSPADYILGITTNFNSYTIVVALVKAVVFGFIITTVGAYKGFYVNGGAVEVSQASTSAVVVTCISILASDYAVTQMLL